VQLYFHLSPTVLVSCCPHLLLQSSFPSVVLRSSSSSVAMWHPVECLPGNAVRVRVRVTQTKSIFFVEFGLALVQFFLHNSLLSFFYVAPQLPNMSPERRCRHGHSPAYCLDRRSSPRSRTYACSHTASYCPSLPFMGIHLHNACKYVY